ncbi:MAG: methionine adenosyltransferase [Bacteroidota bacterium]|jgi:S-adenosylmethionine synthetase
MTTNPRLITSEAVSEGHPDKLADRISDAILDAYLEVDPKAKVACETLITTGKVIIAGEISATGKPANTLIEIAREVLRQTGYTSEAVGFNCDTATYIDLTHSQSPEISSSVEHGGAGDQGVMFGFACDETPQLMPLAITISHEILEALTEKRKSGEMPFLRPDAKSQVTIRYEYGQPTAAHVVIVSTQHDETIERSRLRNIIEDQVVSPILRKHFGTGNAMVIVNPSGSFTIGGPHGDTGLTGRKIIVDSYGGACPHGGGAFSGKDASKVDRSAAYMARYIAKHVVAAGLATKCTVQLSYGIAIDSPISIDVDLYGSSVYVDSGVSNACKRIFDLRPSKIAEKLGLNKPIFAATASGGHFGREEFPWEQLDPGIIAALQSDEETRMDKVELERRERARKEHEGKQKYALLPTQELINTFNKIGSMEFETIPPSAMLAIKFIHHELFQRGINCDLINQRNEAGNITGCTFTIPIRIEDIDGRPTLVRANGEME